MSYCCFCFLVNFGLFVCCCCFLCIGECLLVRDGDWSGLRDWGEGGTCLEEHTLECASS